MKKSALLLLFFGALLANAQSGIPSVISSMSFRGQGGQSGTLSVTVHNSGFPPLTGAPFSGKEERRSEQLLADGTRITQPIQSGAQIARDSQGRTRSERSLSGAIPFNIPGRPAPEPLMIVEINDVVDGHLYILDPIQKIAYRVKYNPVAGRPVPPKPAAPPGFSVNGALIPGGAPENAPQTTTESLGTKYIQGVQTEGLRRTTVTPVGFRGNDRPMTDVTETWTAPTLQLTIQQTTKSPTGNSSSEIVNLSPLNPPADLFRPPPGYQVRDQPESFTVEFGKRTEATPAGSSSRYSGTITPPVPGTQR